MPAFLEAIRRDASRLVAPVQEGGKRLFREVAKVEEICLEEATPPGRSRSSSSPGPSRSSTTG